MWTSWEVFGTCWGAEKEMVASPWRQALRSSCTHCSCRKASPPPLYSHAVRHKGGRGGREAGFALTHLRCERGSSQPSSKGLGLRYCWPAIILWQWRDSFLLLPYQSNNWYSHFLFRQLPFFHLAKPSQSAVYRQKVNICKIMNIQIMLKPSYSYSSSLLFLHEKLVFSN